MKSICLYFQIHQPFRLRTYRFFDIGSDHYYYDDYTNKNIARRIAQNCYLPANQVMMNLIKEFGAKFKVSFSISGTALEQFLEYTPEVIESFKLLAKTGNVEFLGETYSHSLASITSPEEFRSQVNTQSKIVQELFGRKPTTFRNTELIYSNDIAGQVLDMGFNVMLTEGARQVLGWKSPNFLYCSATHERLKLLLRNYQLSDDIAFRFSQRDWKEWPLTADKYMGWLNAIDKKQEIVNLFMDYETFGEHQKADSGILEFLYALASKVIKSGKWRFLTPSEAAEVHQPVAGLSVPHAISWADEERDLTAWKGNDLQDEAIGNLYALAPKIAHCNDPQIEADWHYLQASDHFYYMCTKWFSDGAVHHYFNPYNTPYEAFLNYMNVLSDFIIRVNKCAEESNGVTDKNAEPPVLGQELMKKPPTSSAKRSAKSVSPGNGKKKEVTSRKPVTKK